MKKTIILFLMSIIFSSQAQGIGDSVHDIVKNFEKVELQMTTDGYLYIDTDNSDEYTIRNILYYFDKNYRCVKIKIINTSYKEYKASLYFLTTGFTKVNDSVWKTKDYVIKTKIIPFKELNYSLYVIKMMSPEYYPY
jgi:hypothetical protein